VDHCINLRSFGMAEHISVSLRWDQWWSALLSQPWVHPFCAHLSRKKCRTTKSASGMGKTLTSSVF